MATRFPHFRDELLMMLDEDQREVRACSKTTRQSPKGVDVSDVWERFRAKAKKRADRMIEILNIIGAPTIENVGKDGSQAISVLALHTSLDTMKEVLKSFEDSYKNDPKSVYNEAIPSLTDKVLVVEGKKQKFATQWMLGEDEKFFLPPVEDFPHLNQRREAHGLSKSRHPIDLTEGVPMHKPYRSLTSSGDQREPTKKEYEKFAFSHLAQSKNKE